MRKRLVAFLLVLIMIAIMPITAIGGPGPGGAGEGPRPTIPPCDPIGLRNICIFVTEEVLDRTCE